jgi:hypothetical protein
MWPVDQFKTRTRKTVTKRVLEPVITLIAIIATLFLVLTATRSAR